MKRFERIQNALVGLCLFASLPAWAQFQATGVVTAAGTPKRSVFLTFDDGPDERGPDGLTQIEKIATYLQGPVTVSGTGPRTMSSVGIQKSIRASFAMVACHFIGQDKAAPNSSMCSGYGDVPESVAANVLAAGHDIFNHSQNHLPLTGIHTPAQLIYEVGHAQIEIDKLRGNSPRLFRAPGLAWSAGVAAALNGDPSTTTIQGPVDADVGAAFQMNGTWIGGDWDCFALNLSVPFCGGLYVKAIRQASSGVVVLLHVRTEGMNGRDGNAFALNMAKYIVEHLGPEYEYLPLDAIPGVRGDLMTAPAAKVSVEFAPGDGQGAVLAAGAISGPGKSAGICKARNSAVVCTTGDGRGGFSLATPWLTVNDSTWFVNYGSALWLADINGDGMADLIYPASGMLWVAFNNGQGSFSTPVAYFAGTIPDPQYIHFGKVSGDGRADMVVWAPGQAAPSVYWNSGVRFVAPIGAGPAALASVQRRTVQLIDIDGDGREDLVVRGASQVQCARSLGQGFGALQPCSIAGEPFAQKQEWWNATYGQSFAVAHIHGPVVVGGVPTGLIFAPFSSAAVSNRYRYLCNDCFTNSPDPDWKPELQASQIVWADFTGNGIDSPLLIRADGLYLGLTQASN